MLRLLEEVKAHIIDGTLTDLGLIGAKMINGEAMSTTAFYVGSPTGHAQLYMAAAEFPRRLLEGD
jgi:hypothetical protein